MNSLYKSEIARDEILSLYDEKLASLHLNFEYLSLATSYGKTNVIATGCTSKPPLILVHGANGCAPIALEEFPKLQSSFRVYAIDVVGQPNKSETSKMNMKDDSYGKWMHEIIKELNIEDITLVGFSLGGLIILKTLEYNEKPIKEVYLSSPAYIVNGNPLKLIFNVFIPMKRYMKTKKSYFIEKFLSKVFTDKDLFAIRYLSKVFLNFSMDFSPVPVISKKKASGIQTPIHLFGAENDLMFPGKKLIKRATNIFPSIKTSTLFEGSNHVLSKNQHAEIENRILS